MKKYRSASKRLHAGRSAHSSRKGTVRKFFYPALVISALISATAFSDEWRPRHALVPPTGVLNLPVPAGPADGNRRKQQMDFRPHLPFVFQL